MADPFAQVEQVYAKASAFDGDAKGAFQAAIDANKRCKHGQLGYGLHGDFGMEPAATRERFAFYFDRFPVEVTVK